MKVSEIKTQALKDELERRKKADFLRNLSEKEIAAELQRRKEAARNDPDYEEND